MTNYSALVDVKIFRRERKENEHSKALFSLECIDKLDTYGLTRIGRVGGKKKGRK